MMSQAEVVAPGAFGSLNARSLGWREPTMFQPAPTTLESSDDLISLEIDEIVQLRQLRDEIRLKVRLAGVQCRRAVELQKQLAAEVRISPSAVTSGLSDRTNK